MKPILFFYRHIRYLTFGILLTSLAHQGWSQAGAALNEHISVVGRPSADSISLRWAPDSFARWQAGNTVGYTLERFTMARNGQLLPRPERVVIQTALKPRALDQWERLVQNDQYAAIAAQALYGDQFELDMKESNVFSIVNKVRENEQRFQFALFCADMSPLVARASALYFTDHAVKKGEKYLYKIFTYIERDTIMGSIFINPDEVYSLPAPKNLLVDFKDRLANLRWDKPYRAGLYTAFKLERSLDGKSFAVVSDVPLTTLSPTDNAAGKYEYAVDSVSDVNLKYFYRVRGLTPFGEVGAPSEVVSAQPVLSVKEPPYIQTSEVIENRSIKLEWIFEGNSTELVKGFAIERSGNPSANFVRLPAGILPPNARTFEDRQPATVNYYRVVAVGRDGHEYPSPVHLAQLIDSIPPSPPVDLKAVVDNDGNVSISWKPNQEQDIYGYRVYKGNHEAEELAQITSEPVSESIIRDKVNLNTLTENIFYQVMAIDRNQNHSVLSEKLKVALPDKVRPQPPVMLPSHKKDAGLVVSWKQSGSIDVVRYDVYRQQPPQKEWIRVKMVPASQDTSYVYVDETGRANVTYYYTVVAIDEANLESEPTPAVIGIRVDNSLLAPPVWLEPVIDQEKRSVTLSWNIDNDDVKEFKIYRSIEGGPVVLVKTISGDVRVFVDRLPVGKKHKYAILAVLQTGRKSRMSTEIEILL